MDDTSKETSSTLIYRTALDSTGNIGSFYDAHRDRVVDVIIMSPSSVSHPFHKLRRCEILTGSKSENFDIFQRINIDHESQLSVLLNLTEKKGVAEIYDYPNHINEFTRVFCYTYVERVQKQPNIANKDSQKMIERLRLKKSETHIITEIEWGIDVVVVLELPSTSDSVGEIDRVLAQVCTVLQNDNDILSLTAEKKNILNKIIHTKVFSNINEISGLSTLYDVYVYIQNNRKSPAKHPVSYGMQPITYLYPQYNDICSKFVTLTPELNQRVQRYLIDITLNTRKSKSLIKNYLSTILSQHLQDKVHKAQKQYLDVEKKCSEEVERFAKLVVEVRKDNAKMSRLDEALKDQDHMVMRRALADLNQVLNVLMKKKSFINDLQRFHFQYVDAADCNIDPADNPRTIDNRLISNPECERVLCSNDLLNESDPDHLVQLRNELIGECKNRPELRLVYADFTDCSYKLQHMMRLPLSIYKDQHSTMRFTKTQPSYISPVETKTSSSTSKESDQSALSRKNAHIEPSISHSSVYARTENTDTRYAAKVQTNSPLPEQSKTTPLMTKQDGHGALLTQNSRPPSTKVPNLDTVVGDSHTSGSLPENTKPTLLSTEQRVRSIVSEKESQSVYPKSPQLSKEEQTFRPVSAKASDINIMIVKTHSSDSLTEKLQLTPSPNDQYDHHTPSKQEQQIVRPGSSASGKAPSTDTTVIKTHTNGLLPMKSKSSLPEVNTTTYPDLSTQESQLANYKFEKLQAHVSAKPNSTSTNAQNEPQNPLSPPIKTPTPESSLPTSLEDSDVINILLLGETGVGKSTFVNAFANYLTFDTLQQAEKGQAVVLIPVSFMITVGDNFDEHIVKFGNVDDAKNEDFEHPGQSVTQHCRSYVFNLKNNRGRRLCIIDTPGFGDTRGIHQDDYNMTHILEYIKTLSHLNAVCFLLKPNESRLNAFFRACLTQLFTLLKPEDAENILFCFTNSRSTFYTPGDTAPLLKKMLNSLPKMAVPFRKDNTFCFDSESFRYLVSLQNRVPFSQQDKEDYEMSWTKSVTEAQRLVQHICTTLTAFRTSK